MIKYGDSQIDKIMFGEQMINKVYLGPSLIFTTETRNKYWISGTTVEPNQEVTLYQLSSGTAQQSYKTTSDESCQFFYEEPVSYWGKNSKLILFRNNKNIKTLDLSNVEIPENINSYENLFYGCENLEQLILPKNFWNINVNTWIDVFDYAYKINFSESFKNSDFSHITAFRNTRIFPYHTKFTQEVINNLNLNPETTDLSAFFHCLDLSDLDLSKFVFLKAPSTRMFANVNFNENSVLPAFPNFNDNFIQTFQYCTIPETIINNLTYFENNNYSLEETFYGSRGYENLNPNWKINELSLYHTFENCYDLKTADFSNITITKNEATFIESFKGCSSLSNIKFCEIPVIYEMTGMFANSGLENFNFTETFGDAVLIGSVNNMFEDCVNLSTVDFDVFNITELTSTDYMFRNCYNLQTLNFNTSPYYAHEFNNVQSAESMFENCQTITKLELKNFGLRYDGEPVITNVKNMFKDCTSLYEVDFYGGNDNDFANVQQYEGMFSGCNSLNIIHCTSYLKSWFIEHADEICLPDNFRDEYYYGWRNY